MMKNFFIIISFFTLCITYVILGKEMPKKEIERTLFSTVKIESSTGFGSGTIVDISKNRCLVLTCAHVVSYFFSDAFHIDSLVNIGIATSLEKEPKMDYKAKVVAIDHKNDLAILEIRWKRKSDIKGEILEELTSSDVKIFKERSIMRTKKDYIPIGVDIWTAGYPARQGALLSIDAGKCSGLYKESGSDEEPLHFRISSGNFQRGISGGSVIEAKTNYLIGIPSNIRTNEFGESVNLAVRFEKANLLMDAKPWQSLKTQINKTFRTLIFKVLNENTGKRPQHFYYNIYEDSTQQDTKNRISDFADSLMKLDEFIESKKEAVKSLIIDYFTFVNSSDSVVFVEYADKMSKYKKFTIVVVTTSGIWSIDDYRFHYFVIEPDWTDEKPYFSVEKPFKVKLPK